MPSPLDTDVLIVGAGPAGMVSALCLADLGIECVIVERYPGVNPHPKAHELNARSIEILDGLGITMEELQREAAPEVDGSRILFCKTITEEFGRIDLLEDPGRADKYRQHVRSQKPYLNLSQTELERVVRRHITESPRIELLTEHVWQSLAQNDTGVVSQVEPSGQAAGASSNLLEVRSRYLIGCDGAGSGVREALRIEMIGPERLQDFVNAYFEVGLRDHVPTPAKLYWILHPAAVGAFIAHHVDRRWTYNVMVHEPHEKPDDFTKDVLERRIKIALGTDAYDIRIDSISHWRMTVQVAEAYRDGRVFLVGDSAHRFPPTGGLGMNTGIADAHNLCWKLAAVLNGTASEALLDTYESERRPVAERNAEESRANYDRIFDVVRAFGLSPKAGYVMAGFANHPAVRSLPAFLRRVLLWMVRLPAHFLLDRFWRSRRVRDRVLSSIVDQAGHFDRIGLDIGYVYEEGALAADPDPRSPVEQQVTEYEPTTRPGARFPHVPLGDPANGRSSHDLLGYDHYTLLVGSGGTAWKAALDGLAGGLRTSVQAVLVGEEVDAGPEGVARLETVCGIERDGAVLVRPDGHVAWRRRTMPPNPASALSEAFARVGMT